MMKLNNSHYVHGFSEGNIPFNKNHFSEFKYGNSCNAKKMAIEMYEYFQLNLKQRCKDKNIILYSSPYYKIPTSSLFLSQFIYEALSSEKSICNSTVELDKVDRISTYAEDYGLMTAKQRLDLISNDTYSLKKIPDINSVLIFIDDISITGTHQIILETLLKEKGIENDIIFFYYAKLIDQSDPTIEAYLNNFEIRTCNDLFNLMLSPCFKFTTRTIKYILALEENQMLSIANKMHQLKPDFILELYTMALSNKYDEMDVYKNNLRALGAILPKKNKYVKEV